MSDRFAKVAIVKDFLSWLDESCIFDKEVSTELAEMWAEQTFVRCDTAIASGPGHQSIHPCENTRAGHDEHYDDRDRSWTDEDLSAQTHTKHKYSWVDGRHVKGDVDMVYRLVFSRDY